MGVIRTAALLLTLGALPASSAEVVVAYESGVDAYSQALDGLKSVLGRGGLLPVDLQAADATAEFSRAISARDTKVLVAIGTTSLAAARAHGTAVPMIATMVLHPPAGASLGGYVDLEVPLSTLFSQMRLLLPQGRRAGILRNPLHSGLTTEAIETAARKEGYSAVVVDCDGPASLLRAMATLKGRVDFVLCFPDSDLYNSVTIKPFILASLEGRLPVVGFSPAFVRAGGAAGIYPDYREIGRQTAEMAQRLMRREDRGNKESPRRVLAAVNQRVARLLGIEFHTEDGGVEVLK